MPAFCAYLKHGRWQQLFWSAAARQIQNTLWCRPRWNTWIIGMNSGGQVCICGVFVMSGHLRLLCHSGHTVCPSWPCLHPSWHHYSLWGHNHAWYCPLPNCLCPRCPQLSNEIYNPCQLQSCLPMYENMLHTQQKGLICDMETLLMHKKVHKSMPLVHQTTTLHSCYLWMSLEWACDSSEQQVHVSLYTHLSWQKWRNQGNTRKTPKIQVRVPMRQRQECHTDRVKPPSSAGCVHCPPPLQHWQEGFIQSVHTMLDNYVKIPQTKYS